MRVHPSLLKDMRLALLGELGARSVYARLAGVVRDLELRAVLERLDEAEGEQVERMRELMIELGGDPPARSRRRAVAAQVLVLVSRLVGPRLALRLCQDAEATTSRWYQAYARYLERVSEPEAARTCEELSLTKRRHAQILQTWIDHGRA